MRDPMIAEEAPRPSTARVVIGFLVAFVAAQLVCAGGMLLFLATIDTGLPYKIGFTTLSGAATLAVLGIGIALRKKFKGVLAGSIVGLVLGYMALGPCAFCYLAIAW